MQDRLCGLVLLILMVLVASRTMAQPFASHSVMHSGTWVKMSIAETGVYRVGVNEVPQLLGMNTAQVALYGGDGRVLSADNSEARIDDLPECPLDVVDLNNNGVIDADDYVLFYAEGPVTWRYNSTLGYYTHERHPYDNYNYMYLGLGVVATKRITTVANEASQGTAVTTSLGLALYEQDERNTHNSGLIWVGEKFSSTNATRSFTLTLPSTPTGGDMLLRIGLASVASGASQFRIDIGGVTRTIPFTPAAYYTVSDETFTVGSGATQTVTITYSPSSAADAGYLDFIELSTPVILRYSGSAVTIRDDGTLMAGTVANYRMSNATQAVRVWDVSDVNQVKQLSTTLAGTTLSFSDTVSRSRVYVAFDGSAYFTPVAISTLANQDLHGASVPRMVIVTHSQLLEQANRLASLHEIMDDMAVQVVTQEQVYNEFSSGKQDPMAIRQLMRMFWQRAVSDSAMPEPRYLLLFGKGTYDNRNLLGNSYTTVVTYQSNTSFTDESSLSPTDDMFGYMDDSESGSLYETIDLSIGRLPAKNEAEAKQLVDKIERYMTRADLAMSDIRGDWRDYVTLLADDADPSNARDKDFAESAESLSEQIKTLFPWVNVDKIYADAYVQQSGAIGSYYPDVNNALKQRMDYGCLLLNYIGHGSEQYIGTERYISESDITAYANVNQLSFLVTSTCSFGKYDKLDGECGAEAFVLADGAGVGAISAARPIAHVRSFNSMLVTSALDAATNTVGDALRLTKNRNQMSQNRAVVLLGDPALRLAVPTNNVVVTAINGRTVQPGVDDSCLVLSTVTVEGEIQRADGTLLSDFDGVVYPIVFDREVACRTLANDNEGTEVDFTQQKNVLYKGSAVVTGGRFSYSFIVPRDVAYQFGRGKISHYAKSAQTDAGGAYTAVLFGGFNSEVDLSETRPDIRLYLNDTNFVDGGLTDESPMLYAILEDSVGINAVGSGIGHDITAVLDGNVNDLIVLNDLYQTDIDNSRRGYIQYNFTNLATGRHSLTLKAWNIYNYSSETTLHFVVRSADTTTIGRFLAYPNPATTQTTLHVEHNGKNRIASASYDIYDLHGQQVRHYEPSVNSDAYTVEPVVWDFTTEGGAAVQRGIYVVRALLTTVDGETLMKTAKVVKK